MEPLKICSQNIIVELDRVIIGTNRYGKAKSEADSFAQLDLYFHELGGTTIDTATVYGESTPGVSVSEITIGKWLKNQNRKDVKLISKGCCYKLNAPEVPRLTPEALRADLYQSLDALGTDYVDVFLLHRDNPAVPVGEIMDALNEEICKGTIHAAGVSNWWASRIVEGNQYAQAHDLAKLAVSEIQWSLASQTPGKEILKNEHNAWMTDRELAAYKAAGIPALCYFAQARGYVPKLLSGNPLSPGALDFDNELSRGRAHRAAEIAAQLGCTPNQVALAYLLHSGVESAVLVGASSEAQLRESFACRNICLTPEQIACLHGPETLG